MRDIYYAAVQRRKEHEFLYHYTNKESLEVIKEYNSLRLSRLDKVNDPNEEKRIKSLWKQKIFTACFTNTKDNESYMKENYGKCRITFKTSRMENVVIYADAECSRKMMHVDRSDVQYKKYDEITDWGYYNVSLADIIYVDTLDDYTNSVTEVNAGLVKLKNGLDQDETMREWETECETRIRVAVRPIGLEWSKSAYGCTEYHKPTFEYLYVDIKDKIISIEEL